MKALFGSTPINGLPGVQGYSNYKMNWQAIALGAGAGLFIGLIMGVAFEKKRHQITLIPKNPTPPEIKPDKEIEDAIQNHFNKFDSEIEEADEFDSTE